MAKKVNNINYKGICHSPSLVSDNDGTANECVNLSPDFNDLKPMPMPVKVSDTYTVTDGCTIAYVHQGNGYENYVEINSDMTRLYFRDSQGKYLYTEDANNYYWSNKSQVVAIQSVGDTLVVSTKEGTEYILFRKDVRPTYSGASVSTTSSYKSIKQKPPMPVIEFQMQEDTDPIKEYYDDFPTGEDFFHWSYSSGNYYVDYENENDYVTIFKSLISKIDTRCTKDDRFYKPFFVKYALRMKTGDYIMHSPQVLMLPSTDRCPIATVLRGNSTNAILSAWTCVYTSKLMYQVNTSALFDDWSDIVDKIDIFISDPIDNYDYNTLSGGTVDGNKILVENFTTNYVTTHDFGKRYTDGLIKTTQFRTWFPDAYNWIFVIKEYSDAEIKSKVTGTSLFHKVASLDLSEVSTNTSFKELPIEDLTSLATLPTLPDDYNSHRALSPTLMQTYNSRLNMANISQKVFDGFNNGFQPQSKSGYYKIDIASQTRQLYVYGVYYRIRKEGKVFTVKTPYTQNDLAKLDYCTYLYYPDPDCFEAVVNYGIYNGNTAIISSSFLTIPMKRHEYLNGAYWYDNMNCLGLYVLNNYSGVDPNSPPYISSSLWYELPNRFMMSAVGNPWFFDVANMVDIGRSEIRALAINAENMDAYQYGKNPIYAFCSDGTWTINIKDDGSYNSLSYVSGDVVSQSESMFDKPTASMEQAVFFKTSRGVMMVAGNSVKEIDLGMKGRVFNPKRQLLPLNSVLTSAMGVMGYLDDLINYTCDETPYEDFAAGSNLMYDYRNKRLLLHNSTKPYMYVYDIRYDFWSKMLPLDVNAQTPTPAWTTRQDTYIPYLAIAAAGTQTLVQDREGHLWSIGGQPDENDIADKQFGFYVSRPMRFGTDEYKTLSRIVHNRQLGDSDQFNIAIYGSRNGKDYYRCRTLRGTSYKFFILVFYFYMLPSSRYAYTAFEWEPRLTDKIR